MNAGALALVPPEDQSPSVLAGGFNSPCFPPVCADGMPFPRVPGARSPGRPGCCPPRPGAPLPHSFWPVPLVLTSELSTDSVTCNSEPTRCSYHPYLRQVRLSLQSQEGPAWHTVDGRAPPRNHRPSKPSEASGASGRSSPWVTAMETCGTRGLGQAGALLWSRHVGSGSWLTFPSLKSPPNRQAPGCPTHTVCHPVSP